jgi:hypothetical protein
MRVPDRAVYPPHKGAEPYWLIKITGVLSRAHLLDRSALILEHRMRHGTCRGLQGLGSIFLPCRHSNCSYRILVSFPAVALCGGALLVEPMGSNLNTKDRCGLAPKVTLLGQLPR